MLTDDVLAEIEARAEAATPGPWHWEPDDWGDETLFGPGDIDPPRIVGKTDDNDLLVSDDDAEFIAHARADIPALLAEVRRLEWLVTTARALVECERRVQPFATYSVTHQRAVVDCRFCGSVIVNGGVGHDEGCEWAEFAGAVRMLDEA